MEEEMDRGDEDACLVEVEVGGEGRRRRPAGEKSEGCWSEEKAGMKEDLGVIYILI